MSDLIEIPFGNNTVPAYRADSAGDTLGGVIVIHEVWGLNDHTKDVANRFTKQGFNVIAPDLLIDTGIEELVTPQMQKDLFDPERRSAIQPKIREIMAPIQSPEFAELTNSKLMACFDYLYNQNETNKKVSVVGFCFGGTYSFNLAVLEPRLKSAVPFYGHNDHSVEDLKQIKCPILAFYGEKDENLISNLDNLKDRMSVAGVNFTAQVYPDCGHAFFNDTNPFAYNKLAAEDAWKRTIELLSA